MLKAEKGDSSNENAFQMHSSIRVTCFPVSRRAPQMRPSACILPCPCSLLWRSLSMWWPSHLESGVVVDISVLLESILH